MIVHACVTGTSAAAEQMYRVVACVYVGVNARTWVEVWDSFAGQRCGGWYALVDNLHRPLHPVVQREPLVYTRSPEHIPTNFRPAHVRSLHHTQYIPQPHDRLHASRKE